MRVATVWLLAVVATLLGAPMPRAHARDYDVQSGDWNGLQELVRAAQDVGVELRAASTLDWSTVRRGDGLLMLYPRASVDLNDLSSFLEDGGRLALMDDYGDAGPLLRWFQVTRNEEVRGDRRSPSLPGVLIAYKRAEHPLSEGVDTLTTNEPVAVHHPRLSPVFSLSDDARQGIVLAGQVGRGRLVIGGDPSVLINTMMRFPGNRQFARNLLAYLATRPGGRVHLVHSGFTTRGIYKSRSHAQHPLRELVRNVNDVLGRLGTVAGDAFAVRVLAFLLALGAATTLALRAWGARPSDRFGPTGPAGAAAAVGEKVAIFSLPKANLLYPSLIAKRFFERALLRAVGLRPPTDVGAVLAATRGRLDATQAAELRAVLVDLDALSVPAHEGGPSRVPARQFLSLWRRISAILTALGEK
jgi:hypothetical protein